MRKNVFICFLVICIATLTTGCNRTIIEEERPTMVISQEKFDYADILGFRFKTILDGEPTESSSRLVWFITNPRGEMFDPFFDELVFVHSEEEAVGFPDNVIVAWPWALNVDSLINILHVLVNRCIDDLTGRFTSPERDIITLEEFGLSYPLTIADIVDNWGKMNALIHSLSHTERIMIGVGR